MPTMGKAILSACPTGIGQQCHLRVKDGTLHNEPGLAVSSSNRALGKITSLPSSSVVIQALPEVKLNGNSGLVK